jgi:hypothetical protein
MEPRYRTTSVLSKVPFDWFGCFEFYRRRVSCALFISDALSCKLDCPIILSSLRLNVYFYITRYRFLLKEKILTEQIMGWMSPWICYKDIQWIFKSSWIWWERMSQSSCVIRICMSSLNLKTIVVVVYFAKSSNKNDIFYVLPKNC